MFKIFFALKFKTLKHEFTENIKITKKFASWELENTTDRQEIITVANDNSHDPNYQKWK